MKRIFCSGILQVVAVASFLCVMLVSCSDRSRQVRQTIYAADSLIMGFPDAALDTLETLGHLDLLRLSPRNRNHFILLMTEAKYKNWHPVANDTLISDAVKYFRSFGPKDKYARALLMEGAVLREKGDTWAAMESYKAAEPVLESIGDMEQLGLLHTRIGELYQSSYVYIPERIRRLQEALRCFSIAGKKNRMVALNYSLASAYMAIDSLANGHHYIMEGITVAEDLRDTLRILRGLSLLCGYHYYSDPPEYSRCRETAFSALNMTETGRYPSYYTDEFSYYMAASNAGTGDADSAEYYLARMRGNDMKTEIRRYSLKSKIAESKGDILSAKSNRIIADSLYYNELVKGYEENLYESEMAVENRLLEEQYEVTRKRQTIYVLSGILVFFTMIIIGFIFHSRYRKLKYDAMKSRELVRLLDNDSKKKELEISEITRLSQDIKRQLGNETSAKEAWIALHENLLKMEDSLLDAYYRYGTTKSFSMQVSKIIDGYFPDKQTSGQVMEIVNLAYPGFLESLRNEHSALTGQNLYLIALVACGFSTGAICAIYRCSENTLNVTKYRIGRKLGIETSLSSYISGTLESYRRTGSGLPGQEILANNSAHSGNISAC